MAYKVFSENGTNLLTNALYNSNEVIDNGFQPGSVATSITINSVLKSLSVFVSAVNHVFFEDKDLGPETSYDTFRTRLGSTSTYNKLNIINFDTFAGDDAIYLGDTSKALLLKTKLNNTNTPIFLISYVESGTTKTERVLLQRDYTELNNKITTINNKLREYTEYKDITFGQAYNYFLKGLNLEIEVRNNSNLVVGTHQAFISRKIISATSSEKYYQISWIDPYGSSTGPKINFQDGEENDKPSATSPSYRINAYGYF